jgi:tetratricopeptide (TPR) repeat protein
MLQYSSDPGKDKIERPLVTPSGQSYNSAEQLFRVAEDMYSMRDYGAALKTYLECVEKEPTHSRALTKIAELYYRRAMYQEALEYAKRVLENNTYDGGANFIYAAVQNKLGKQLQAEEAYSVAVRSMEFRSAAYVQIAGLNLSKKNYNKAITYARKALDFNRYNITAYEFLSMAYRKLNMGKMSENILDDLSDIDPLNHFARYERYLLNPSESTRSAFNSVITNEFPHETYLEIAMIYANHGLEEEAISVLEQSPEYPTVCYWLAYLYRLRSPEKSKSYLEKAVNMSPVRVFPFRTEIIPVLHWAQQKLPGWKNQYYLGLVNWYIHRIGKAKEYFKRCGNAPDYAPFYIARGELFKDDEKHSDLILSDFKRALTSDPDEWRSWFYLTGYLESRGQYTEQLEYSGKAWSRFQDKPEIGIDYAKALVNNSKFKAALKVLQKIQVQL